MRSPPGWRCAGRSPLWRRPREAVHDSLLCRRTSRLTVSLTRPGRALKNVQRPRHRVRPGRGSAHHPQRPRPHRPVPVPAPRGAVRRRRRGPRGPRPGPVRRTRASCCAASRSVPPTRPAATCWSPTGSRAPTRCWPASHVPGLRQRSPCATPTEAPPVGRRARQPPPGETRPVRRRALRTEIDGATG